MKKSPSYISLFVISAICLGVNILINIGVIGIVLKTVGLAALIWGTIEYFKNNKETAKEEKDNKK